MKTVVYFSTCSFLSFKRCFTVDEIIERNQEDEIEVFDDDSSQDDALVGENKDNDQIDEAPLNQLG